MTFFLLHYHRPTALMTYREYEDGHAAMEQRFADEKTVDSDTEVVVLCAKDLATIQQTHSRYFSGDWGRADADA